MAIHESGENYLEQLLILSKEKEKVRAIDLAAALGFARPTVSVMLRDLRRDGFVDRLEDDALLLTAKGRAVAERIYERHCVLTDMLVALGVPREAIWFSEQPRNTEEEARLLKAEMAGNSPRILLVTSAWHMARARMLFRRAGFDVIPAPTDFEMNCAAERPLALADFFPCADALLRNSAAVKEWVGLMGCSLLRR